MPIERFPLPESAAYSYAQRFNAEHRGTDIMAPHGTPVLAVERGTAWSNIEPKGGNVVYLQGASGWRYFYGHLATWQLQVISATQQQPVEVEAGAELGVVGNTGNAAGGPPHLHFQQRTSYSRGWQTVDPFPDLVRVDPKRGGVPGRGYATLGTQEGTAALLVFAFLLFKSQSLKSRLIR